MEEVRCIQLYLYPNVKRLLSEDLRDFFARSKDRTLASISNGDAFFQNPACKLINIVQGYIKAFSLCAKLFYRKMNLSLVIDLWLVYVVVHTTALSFSL